MQLSAVWLIPLGAGAAGAAGLTFVAVRLRKEVELLQRSMRPLRTDHRGVGHRRGAGPDGHQVRRPR